MSWDQSVQNLRKDSEQNLNLFEVCLPISNDKPYKYLILTTKTESKAFLKNTESIWSCANSLRKQK